MSLIVFRRRFNSGAILGSTGVGITAWLWISLTVVTMVASQQNFYMNGRYGKRQEADQATLFRTGSRYGRNNGGVGSGMKQPAGKEMEVTPRMDRFFLGSRYGKRTSSNDENTDTSKHFESLLDRRITEKEQLKMLTQRLMNSGNLEPFRSNDEDSTVAEIFTTSNRLACFYTGTTNLYRCFRRGQNATESNPAYWNNLL